VRLGGCNRTGQARDLRRVREIGLDEVSPDLAGD